MPYVHGGHHEWQMIKMILLAIVEIQLSLVLKCLSGGVRTCLTYMAAIMSGK
jgi:hypothetical protein